MASLLKGVTQMKLPCFANHHWWTIGGSVQCSLWLMPSWGNIVSSIWAPLNAFLNLWWGHVDSIQCLVQWHFREVLISSDLSLGSKVIRSIAVRGSGQADIETTQELRVMTLTCSMALQFAITNREQLTGFAQLSLKGCWLLWNKKLKKKKFRSRSDAQDQWEVIMVAVPTSSCFSSHRLRS